MEVTDLTPDGAYIGVDLDGTLAAHGPDDWDGVSVREPIPLMVERVKAWLDRGLKVRIITARVSPIASRERLDEQHELISEWLVKHVGQDLPVQAWKCYHMTELWDDRAIQVQRDTGVALVHVAQEAFTALSKISDVVNDLEDRLKVKEIA